MAINVEIFSQGEELLTGQTIDTNSAWLSEQLVTLGFKVKRHTAVGDCLPDLVNLLTEIASRADCCLCTGGLGPTLDDLTAEAVAEAFGLPLQFDAEAYAQIRAFFARRQRPMPEVNRKQALLPQGAIRLDNAWGTAPGFALRYQACWFAFMPGVPSEMRNMFAASVKPYLQTHYALQPHQYIAIRTIGLGESSIQQLIHDITLPDSVQLGFCAAEEEVKTKLEFPFDYPIATKQALVQQFTAKLGDHVFAIDELSADSGTLVDILAQLMISQELTLALIETVSQGLIAAKCVAQPWLVQARYQRDLPNSTTIERQNQPTENWQAAALQLATLEQQHTQADLVLLQMYQGERATSIHQEQCLEVFNFLLTPQGCYNQQLTLAGTARRIQNQAAILALDFLRRYLQQKLK